MTYLLLIEDNRADADIIIHILTSAGYQIKHCLKGLEGSRQARIDRPLLILMNLQLPDINGCVLAFNLRRQLGKDAPPIIAYTGRTGSSEQPLAEHFGCSGSLTMPFTPDQLLTHLTQR